MKIGKDYKNKIIFERMKTGKEIQQNTVLQEIISVLH